MYGKASNPLQLPSYKEPPGSTWQHPPALSEPIGTDQEPQLYILNGFIGKWRHFMFSPEGLILFPQPRVRAGQYLSH